MMHSIIKNRTVKKLSGWLIAALFWIFLWYLISMKVNKEILIVSPMRVLLRFFELSKETDFWMTAAVSLLRILLGFFIGIAAGVICAVLTAKISFLRTLLSPMLGIIKATPVASFIILAFVWMKNENIPAFTSFLMVLPIVWGNMFEGVNSINPEMKAVAHVFGFGRLKTAQHVHIPHLLPYLRSACVTSMGLAWKAGIAAEVITTPPNSIGSEIRDAKVYLETADLFVWTAVVIILSIILENGFNYLTKKLVNTKLLYKITPTGRLKGDIAEKNPLSLENVEISFKDNQVLKDITFTAPKKGIFYIEGESGAGKSTLLNAIAGLLSYKGKIENQGQISVAFQENRLFSHLTALENLLVVSDTSDSKKARKLLESFGLGDSADKYPHELSGGMAQRVSVARALSVKSDTLLLDEPLSALDGENRSNMLKMLDSASNDCLVVIATHHAYTKDSLRYTIIP